MPAAAVDVESSHEVDRAFMGIVGNVFDDHDDDVQEILELLFRIIICYASSILLFRVLRFTGRD